MSACVTRIFLVDTFQIRTRLHHLIDSIVFLQLSIDYISAGPKYIYIYICMLYKTKLQHDRCMLVSVIRADLHTQISKSWHVNFW